MASVGHSSDGVAAVKHPHKELQQFIAGDDEAPASCERLASNQAQLPAPMARFHPEEVPQNTLLVDCMKVWTLHLSWLHLAPGGRRPDSFMADMLYASSRGAITWGLIWWIKSMFQRRRWPRGLVMFRLSTRVKRTLSHHSGEKGSLQPTRDAFNHRSPLCLKRFCRKGRGSISAKNSAF